MSETIIEITGDDAEEAVRELQEWLRAELGEAGSRVEPDREERAPVRGDPVAITALILSIPPTVLAVADLAKRMELTERFGRLLDRIKGRSRKKLRFAIVGADGRPVDLDRASAGEVVDVILEDQNKTRGAPEVMTRATLRLDGGGGSR